MSQGLGNVPTLRIFFHGENNFTVHRPPASFQCNAWVCYTGTGIVSTMSRRISSACCDFFRVEE
jgi:hypothetical protein